MNGIKPGFEKRVTADGSISLFSEEYGEGFHSVSGALKEALERFVLPCRIPALARRGKISILDIGFGLGYNSAVAVTHARRADPSCVVRILGLEKDPRVIALLRDTSVPDAIEEAFSLFRRLPGGSDPSVEGSGVEFALLLGDAQERIREVEGLFDAVFLDPFSPGKNPELWTTPFFREIKRLLGPGALVSTYSAATQVKLAFLEAGFRIGPGPKVGIKGMGTLATVTGEVPAMKPRELRKLMRRLERERESEE